ncbi:MAG TPA: hypothetical protein VFA08_01160 [Actinomycetota bacterium]|nr:hypothetical protein [Actinomycetota bacterium]
MITAAGEQAELAFDVDGESARIHATFDRREEERLLMQLKTEDFGEAFDREGRLRRDAWMKVGYWRDRLALSSRSDSSNAVRRHRAAIEALTAELMEHLEIRTEHIVSILRRNGVDDDRIVD